MTVLAALSVVIVSAAAVPRTASAATVTPRIDLRVLVLGTSTSNANTDPDATAWTDALQREGVPFDGISVTASTAITSATLSTAASDGTPEGKYEAVIASYAGMSALSASSKTALEQYEEAFDVRQVTSDVYPGGGTYGLNAYTAAGALDGQTASLTAAGQSVFPYLKGPVMFDTLTYGYEATPTSTTNFKPLVSLGAYAMVGIYTHPDGVEELVTTFNQNPSQLQSWLLRHGVIDWVTHGVYFGTERNYAESDIDDLFNTDDSWDTTTNTNSGTLSATQSDIESAAAWSAQNGFRLDFAFNGNGDDQGLLSTFSLIDPATGKPYADSFAWINHTYDHPNIDDGCATAPYIESEIGTNLSWAGTNLHLTESSSPPSPLGYINPTEVITGEHSGLANLIPGYPGTLDDPTLTSATASSTPGTLPLGTYEYAITDQFIAGGGESAASAPSAQVALAAPGAVTLTWPAVCKAADYVVYRGTVGASGTTWVRLGTTVPQLPTPFADDGTANSVTYTDTGADAGTAVTALPAANNAVEGPYEQNPQLNTAFAAEGIVAFGADASKPYPSPADQPFAPEAPGTAYAGATYPAGTSFPDGNAWSVPRYPTNVFYNVSTAAQELAEYNYIYLPQSLGGICQATSTNTCLTAPLTDVSQVYSTIDSIMFSHLMGNDPRPTFFHQSNLIGGSGTGLYYQVMNPLLSEYNTYFQNEPITQPTLAQAAAILKDQTNWAANTAVSGYIQGNQVVITNAGASADVPLTGITNVGASYGGTQSGWTTVSGTSTYTAQITWPAPRTLTVQLAPTSIVANGTSQSTATVTVANSDGFPIVGESPAITSTDPAQKISAVTDNNNGTYTATITSSTTVGPSTITATDTALPPFSFTGAATLTQAGGPAASLTIQLSPTSIVANGTSTSTATATVKDAQGRADIGDRVAFTSSDSAEKVGAVSDNADGTYTATITSSTVPHEATVTATDSSVSPTLSAQASLSQTAAPSPSPSPSPSPAPSPAPSMDTTAPKVAIGGGSLAKISGKVAVKLTCPQGQTFCAGTVTLKVAGGAQKGLVLGSTSFNLVGGTTETVKVTPPKASLRKLGKAVSIRVLVGVTAQNKAGLKGNSQRSMTLYLVLDATKPVVGIGAGALSYNAAPLTMQLTCPGSQTYCEGTVAIISTTAGHTVMVLGASHFHIARDTTATVKVSLSKAALAKLGKTTTVTVTITASATDQAGHPGTATRTTALRMRPTGS